MSFTTRKDSLQRERFGQIEKALDALVDQEHAGTLGDPDRLSFHVLMSEADKILRHFGVEPCEKAGSFALQRELLRDDLTPKE